MERGKVRLEGVIAIMKRIFVDGVIIPVDFWDFSSKCCQTFWYKETVGMMVLS